MTCREWVELRIAQLQRRLVGSLPADHRHDRVRDELWHLQRELDEMDRSDD